MQNKIYISNIPQTASDKDLFELFSPLGQVVSAKIIVGMDPTKNAGYGYVTMSNEEETKKAILKLNKNVFKGNAIRVVEAHVIDQDGSYFARQNRYRRNRRY